jgi:LemA protein
MPEVARASEQVSGAVRHLFAVAERYPELKVHESFVQLQGRISQLEDWIADRRELYNAAVTSWNTRLEQVPDLFVARLGRMQKRELWRAKASDRPVPSLKFA